MNSKKSEELQQKFYSWNPEILFDTENGIQLFYHIYTCSHKTEWIVRWHQGEYDCNKAFWNFVSAKDYYLEKVEEMSV